MAYAQHFSTKKTPQTQPIPGKEMVENNAGGHSFAVSKWTSLDRFLILGSQGGSYYASEKKLTVDNAEKVIECIKEDGRRVVKTIVGVSLGGRAPKNDPAIFALALCSTFGDELTKMTAYFAISKVCRIGTHIFQFCAEVNKLRGWGRGLRSGVSRFYTGRKEEDLAHQLIKYQQRNGWTHRDVLRLAHPSPLTPEMRNLFAYAVGKPAEGRLPAQIEAFEKIKSLTASDHKKAVELILEYRLPRECVPTVLLNNASVWEALLAEMPLTAMIRNLGKMTSVGVLGSNLSVATKDVVKKLTDAEYVSRSRVHPLNVLIAGKIYAQGHGEKGSLNWSPLSAINDALDDAFHLAFDSVEPVGKSFFLGVDVSGSMTSRMNHLPLTYSEAAAAMAMVAVRTEPHTEVYGFDTGLKSIPLNKKHTFAQAAKMVAGYNGGGTDCALPMLYALKEKIPVDVFQVYTDNETWAGEVHPVQALQEYRQRMGIPAKLVVFGMAADEFTIADPNDAGMLDVVGLDSSVPAAVASFLTA